MKTKAFIADVNVGTTKQGKPYASLVLHLESGERVDGKIWNLPENFVTPRGPHEVTGRWNEYQGEKQLVLSEWTPVDVALNLFLPVSVVRPDEREKLLANALFRLGEPHATLANEILRDAGWERFIAAPAASRAHGACMGGLVMHTLAVHDVVESYCEAHPGLDWKLALAGALVHDVGKVHEYSLEPGFPKTVAGRLRGHIVMGAELVQRSLRTLKTPERVVGLLEHIVLSHHGRLEWGSPVVPSIPEAVLVHQADLLVSRMEGVEEAVEKTTPGTWTEKVFVLDGAKLYVAPKEA